MNMKVRLKMTDKSLIRSIVLYAVVDSEGKKMFYATVHYYAEWLPTTYTFKSYESMIAWHEHIITSGAN